jgi:DNA-binding GntR family transcriptional regulator
VRNSHTEHGAVVDAILRGDADAADELMRRHIAVQGDTFADFLSALPAAYSERATG